MQATIIRRLPKDLYKPVITTLYSKVSTTGFTRNELMHEIIGYYEALSSRRLAVVYRSQVVRRRPSKRCMQIREENLGNNSNLKSVKAAAENKVIKLSS